MKNLFIETQGCQMNEYDSSRMADLLAKTHGLKLSNEEDADLLLLNTCSIREKAQEKVFDKLGRWRILKNKRPEIVIGVGGCVASQEGEALRKRAPFVDMVFGPQTWHRVPNMLNHVTQERSPVVDISFPEIEKFDNLPEPRVDGPSAFVSIMEGCSKYCTYCVVPYTRGEEISRPFDDVIAECYVLAQKGVKEITLLGQNVNAYQGERHDGSIADLSLLLHYLAEIDGIERLRYTTSHPVEFSDNLIAAYASIPQLANHLHLPVQSGSNKILRLMKRGHTREEYIEKMNKLKAVRPDISISSDFIVGYPGETEQDFIDTMDLVHEIGFDHSFSFIFSKRPGTPAANFGDKTPMEEKKQRLQMLQQRLNIQSQRISDAMVGSTQKIIVTGKSKKNPLVQICGRTENNRVVNFNGNADLIGKTVEVKIVQAFPNSLQGELAL